MIDLSPDQLKLVKQIFKQHAPNAEVWAFGSRVAGTARNYSDLDLVVVGKERLPLKEYYQLQDAFEESELPIKVDVLDWYRITPKFRENIQKDKVVLQAAET